MCGFEVSFKIEDRTRDVNKIGQNLDCETCFFWPDLPSMLLSLTL